ncbi:hypothetical protein ACJRO7_003284 [Eucalyptus globulus]|uniref:SHSP domain-containing protein n=1 Tax=Eucalyptus globulus TaxID=34317 RepID=A0ABD3IV67_EUCGL
MAMRSGAPRPPTSSSPRPQEMTRPRYEDIQPKSEEWREEKAAHVLDVHLPGFVKEQIRVTLGDNSLSFNVRGERPLGDNRIGRLNMDYIIPDNSKMKEMEGRFQDEVLTITIPKEYVSPFFVPKENGAGAQTSPEKAPSTAQKPPVISEPPRVTAPPETPLSSTTKQPERRSDYEKLESPKGTSWEREMKRANDTDVAGFDGKEVSRHEKSDSDKSKAGESRSGADDAGKTKRDGNLGEAEKQLLLNMGLAALTLVALGAYVGYNFALS